MWVVLRMKEHMVSKVLKQRLQGDTTSSLQQAAFEQVSSMSHCRVESGRKAAIRQQAELCSVN